MKTIFILFLLSIYYCSIAQLRDAPEIYIYTVNIYDNSEYTYTMKPISIQYSFTKPYYQDWFECEDCDDEGTFDITGNLPYGSNAIGYSLHVWDPPPGNDLPVFGHALLKFFVNDIYFYLDLRDNDFHNWGGNGYVSTSPDMYIKYDGKNTSDYTDDEIYFSYKSWPSYVWHNCSNNVIKIWEEYGYSFPSTDDFPDFWENCLAIGWHWYQNYQLIWSRNPNQYFIQKYYLYRKINNGNWYRIGVFNSHTFNYKDKALIASDNNLNTTVSYYVTSYNGIESGSTNSVTIVDTVDINWSNGLILSVTDNNHPYLV